MNTVATLVSLSTYFSSFHNTDENSPDPFQYHPGPMHAPPTAADIHPQWAVYVLYLLVVWLHSQFHVPFCACSAFLAVVTLAF